MYLYLFCCFVRQRCLWTLRLWEHCLLMNFWATPAVVSKGSLFRDTVHMFLPRPQRHSPHVLTKPPEHTDTLFSFILLKLWVRVWQPGTALPLLCFYRSSSRHSGDMEARSDSLFLSPYPGGGGDGGLRRGGGRRERAGKEGNGGGQSRGGARDWHSGDGKRERAELQGHQWNLTATSRGDDGRKSVVVDTAQAYCQAAYPRSDQWG